MKRYELGNSVLINSDNMEVLKSLPDNSIDSVVTDPPYGISFMGKKWDYDVPSVELWKEVYRVLKPGGHLLCACGTRTQHRMAVNIEDAGFEIRDVISWVYGSGFPKSLNIGKAIDKIQGNEREIVGTKILGGIKRARPDNAVGYSNPYTSGQSIGIDTKGHSEFEGWGTALKPACEFFTLARKPISESNIAENVLKWGTGGINIDECRIGNEEIKTCAKTQKDSFAKSYPTGISESTHFGRFPANFIHDGSDEVVKGFPETKSPKTYIRKSDGYSTGNSGIKTIGESNGDESLNYGDSGSAARFFYCAKASPSERNEGLEGLEEKTTKITNMYEMVRDDGTMRELATKQNHHPTVKPIALMEYLIRLITPKGGTVLDPFAGSGTTGIAAINLKVKYILIEREEEYCTIADARLKHFYNKIEPELFEAVNAF